MRYGRGAGDGLSVRCYCLPTCLPACLPACLPRSCEFGVDDVALPILLSDPEPAWMTPDVVNRCLVARKGDVEAAR